VHRILVKHQHYIKTNLVFSEYPRIAITDANPKEHSWVCLSIIPKNMRDQFKDFFMGASQYILSWGFSGEKKFSIVQIAIRC
jgi:hypothetical protein